MTMLKIIGDTYKDRFEFRKLGLTFDYTRKTYIGAQTTDIETFCVKYDYDWETIEDVELGEKFEVEQKNIRANQRAKRYEDRAENNYAKAESTTLSKGENDFLSLCEPVKVGHHSEGRHRKLLEKARNTMDKRVELYNKSDEYSSKAEYWKSKKYYTIEEKEQRKNKAKTIRSLAEELRRQDYKIGDQYIGRHTSSKIVKINGKTVKLESGGKRDIAYAKDFDEYMKKANVLFNNLINDNASTI